MRKAEADATLATTRDKFLNGVEGAILVSNKVTLADIGDNAVGASADRIAVAVKPLRPSDITPPLAENGFLYVNVFLHLRGFVSRRGPPRSYATLAAAWNVDLTRTSSPMSTKTRRPSGAPKVTR